MLTELSMKDSLGTTSGMVRGNILLLTELSMKDSLRTTSGMVRGKAGIYSFGVLMRELLARKASSPGMERAPLERLRADCLLADRGARPSAAAVGGFLRGLRPVSGWWRWWWLCSALPLVGNIFYCLLLSRPPTVLCNCFYLAGWWFRFAAAVAFAVSRRHPPPPPRR